MGKSQRGVKEGGFAGGGVGLYRSFRKKLPFLLVKEKEIKKFKKKHVDFSKFPEIDLSRALTVLGVLLI